MRTVKIPGEIDLSFSSNRTGVPERRSMIDGNIFCSDEKSNSRLNHFICPILSYLDGNLKLCFVLQHQKMEKRLELYLFDGV